VVEIGKACKIFLGKGSLGVGERIILIGILNKWVSGCEQVVYGLL